MRIRVDSLVILGGLALVATGAGTAAAEDSPDTTVDATTGEEVAPVDDPANKVEFGLGVRFRNVRGPSAMVELFVENSAGGSSNLGLGVELTRRKGNSELQLGIEFERITPKAGVWIASGDNVPQDEADYILDPENTDGNVKLGWITAEFTYFHHVPLTKQIALRFGGGLGIGIVTGELQRIDVVCASTATNDNPEPGCVPERFQGGAVSEGNPVAYDLPPVFPVINAIAGVQFRPIENVTVNLEGGLRTFLFFGLSSSYFF